MAVVLAGSLGQGLPRFGTPANPIRGLTRGKEDDPMPTASEIEQHYAEQPQEPLPPKKKHHRVLWFVVLPVGLVTALGIGIGAANSGTHLQGSQPPASVPAASAPASASAPPAPTPTPGVDVMPMGTTGQFGTGSTTDLTIKLNRPEVSTVPVDAYSSGPAKGYFVAIHVAAAATADQQSVYSGDFYVKVGHARYDEGNGNASEGPHGIMANGDQELGFQDLNAGDATSGWLLFDLPKPHGTVFYAPNLDGGPLAAWTF